MLESHQLFLQLKTHFILFYFYYYIFNSNSNRLSISLSALKYYFSMEKRIRERLLCGRCTKQEFCAIHLEFDTSSLKENCKNNICEQNTGLCLLQTFEPPLASARCQCRHLKPPPLTPTKFGVAHRLP